MKRGIVLHFRTLRGSETDRLLSRAALSAASVKSATWGLVWDSAFDGETAIEVAF